jgi:ATP:ADP antiporter, AAA family
MTALRSRPDSVVLTAMVCAGVVTAQFIGGKAARDALFLAQLDVTSLPTMVIATAIFSIGLAAISSQGITRLSPARFVPLTFAASATFLVVEWLLTYAAPKPAAVLVYLHISGLGPMLGSGFWLITIERFDPRTGKKRFGQITAAGTLGGVLGGLAAERMGVTFGVSGVLPFLAALNLVCAWRVRQLAHVSPSGGRVNAAEPSPDLAPEAPQSGLRVLAGAPYLRNLAALVVLGTLSAALMDYLFKAEAVATFGRGEGLLRFFAIYYTGTSLITFVVQTFGSQFLLQRFGLAVPAGTPSFALLVGNIAGLLVPGLGSLTVARGGESVLRGSLFRAGYELFYIPIPASERRAAKSIIDVGFDRLGDALGGGIVRLALLVAPAAQHSIILSVGLTCSAAAIAVASRLNRGYIHTLEKSLLNRAVELDLSDIEDLTTQTTMLRTLQRPRIAVGQTGSADHDRSKDGLIFAGDGDPELQEIMWLRSRDRERVVKVLRTENGLTAALVPHVIPLLAWGPVVDDALFALRKVAEERVGELTDALIDPNQDFAVRRRLARVFSVCVSQRAVDGLTLGLDDLRFEVRFQCARSLSAIFERNPLNRINSARILEVVLREVAVGQPVWEGRRLLDALETDAPSFAGDVVRDRAGQSLAHVFTLLSLVLPREPLQVAFRGLHTDDQNLRGTALEYLEGVLPPSIRERLWPFLEDRRPVSRAPRSRDEILADLLRSNQSILMNLEELKRPAGTEQDEANRAVLTKARGPADPGT